jgi:all-trans-retinol dehydrogenase (NAD+)
MSVLSVIRPNSLLALSVPLLLLLTKAPTSVQAKLLPNNTSRVEIIKFLAFSLALGLGAQLNSLLSAWARNNWVWGTGRGAEFGKDGWEKEVAVVTGGSNGIGALIAKGLAAKGVKVAILDIVEPAEDDGTHETTNGSEGSRC